MRPTLQVLASKGLPPVPMDALLPLYCLPASAYIMLNAGQL